MKTWFWPAAAYLAVMVFFYLCGFQRRSGAKKSKMAGRGWGFACKCIPTLCTALLCLTGCLLQGGAAHWWLFVGLCLCTLADGVLDVRFVPGMGLFALGHGCYITAFCLENAPAWPQLGVFLVLSCALWGAYVYIKQKQTEPLPFPLGLGVLYGMVLFAMLSLSLGQSGVLMLGAVLFVVSDVMLALGILRILRGKKSDYICLAVYYLAQYLIGLSVFF